jgi:hypothetical protein
LRLLVCYESNSDSRMDNLNPVNGQTKLRHSSQLTSRKVWIWLLSAMIVAAMIAWLTFLGWGLIEALRALEKLVKSFF